jgi:O-antigen/teichoic acid export membrane protein
MRGDSLKQLNVAELGSSSPLPTITGPVSAVVRRFPLASRGLLSIIDQAVYSGTSFATAVLIGRATSPDQLGIYYLMISIILAISGVQEQLVAAPYVVYSKRRQGRELAEYAGSMWAHNLVITIVAAAGLLIAIFVLSANGFSKSVPGLLALLSAAPILLFRQWIRRFSLANLDVRSTILLDTAISIMQLGGLAALGYFGLLSLLRIFLVMGSSSGLACAGWYLWSRPRLQFVPARFLADWRHNWVFSKWALQTYVLGNSTPQLMVWLVSATIGAASTGIFGACSNLVGLSYVILCGVGNVLTPQAAHAYATGGVKELRRVLLIAGAFMALTTGGMCMVVLTTGDWLVVLAFGPHYYGTGAILFVLALASAMNALSIICGNGLWAIDQPRLNFVADVCCMVVTLVAAAILIASYGVLGAALASLAGATSAAILRAVTVVRYLADPPIDADVVIGPALSS